MKSIILFSTIIGLTFTSYSQKINEIKVTSNIEKLTVFLTGGEVTRSKKINLKKGRNKIVYTGISTVIDSKSIQFSTNSNCNLVSVSTAVDYLSQVEPNSKIKIIKDSIKFLNLIQNNLTNERAAYSAEKKLLEKNNIIKGEQNNLTVDELKSMADFYRKRMMLINKKITEYDLKIYDNKQNIRQFNQQLSELNYIESVHSNQVIVIVDSDLSQEISTQLKYIVSNCGWQANYDLLASDINGKIKLKYKAKVYNNTGNDWNNVNILLSTSNPNVSANAPKITPWYLNSNNTLNDKSTQNSYLVPQKQQYKKYYNNATAPQQNGYVDGLSLSGAAEWNTKVGNISNQKFKQMVQITSIEVPQLSNEFQINKKYTIPSDSKPYIVEISTHDLNATFSHKAVPKLDHDAFLLANIVGWEKLNLISGPTNVYYDNSYVGQSYINTRNVEDTLRLSFGRDKKVLITREKLDEFSSKSVLGNNKKDTYTFEITVKNNQNINLKMNLYDQIPVSQESEITVTVNEISDANYNEDNGILDWNVNLKPGEAKKYKVSFTIKYPKNRTVQVTKYRTISCPSF